jgi:chemotaxis methyl-accepting protein methylase
MFSFQSNSGYYRAESGNNIGTCTKLFRADLDWDRFSSFLVKHFKDKENVQFIQFASSDGSEAYTQIISLIENFKPKEVDKFFPIEAFDINERIYKMAKSGLINIFDYEKDSVSDKGKYINKYFKKTDKKCNIEGEVLNNVKTYEVSKTLTDKVNFHNADMWKILKNHEDKSNTVILCRNVLDYFSDREVDYFTTLLACVLKKGSIFVTGEIDGKRIDDALMSKGFLQIMPKVYMQT